MRVARRLSTRQVSSVGWLVQQVLGSLLTIGIVFAIVQTVGTGMPLNLVKIAIFCWECFLFQR